MNAVLRGYTREREETRATLEALKQSEPATGYSQPDWLVERWTKLWGKEKTIQLLNWNNTPSANVRTHQHDKSGRSKAETGLGFGARDIPLSSTRLVGPR